MASVHKYIDALGYLVFAAVWKHMNTRRDLPGKSLDHVELTSQKWLSKTLGVDAAPAWLRDRMYEAIKSRFEWDWEGDSDPIGSVTNAEPKPPEQPGANEGASAESERDAFADWAEFAMKERLHMILTEHGQLREMPPDVMKWLNGGGSGMTPTSILGWASEALENLNWD